MGRRTTIEAPKPDPAQTAYYEYMRQHQINLDKQTEDAATEEKNNLNAIRTTGKSGYNTFKTNLLNQWKAGMLNTDNVKQQFTDYENRYKLGTGFTQEDLNTFVDAATQAQTGKTQLLAGQTYKDVLGREATQSELQSFSDLYKTGDYKLSDLVSSIKSGSEYQNKFNQSYLDNYYKTMYGPQQTTADSSGQIVKTGKYTFNYNPSLDPVFTGDLAKATGISTGSIPSSFTGTPAELEEAQQALRQKRQFAYDAGLTSLQGEIDKNVQRIKNEGGEAVQRIASTGQLMSNLTQGFWA